MLQTEIPREADREVITIRCAATPPDSWNAYLVRFGYDGFHLRREWADVFQESLSHQPHFIWAEDSQRQLKGVLPLMFVSGPIFGRYLVSQPYLNTGGVLADSEEVARQLIDQAVRLADRLDVKHLELRHEQHRNHACLNATSTEKVHMRLQLPSTTDDLWNGLKSKVRSRLRRPVNASELTCEFGREDQLDAFYRIFCINMRDLGTPPFSRALFAAMLRHFPEEAEICTVSLNGLPVASGFLLHGPQTTFIPSASALRNYNKTCANMLMYWHALCRTIERGQSCFDFGRSTPDSGTYKFKRQWGAEEFPAIWQYYSRHGCVTDARPGSGKYDRMIEMWKKLPVWFTKLIGPSIVRGIP